MRAEASHVRLVESSERVHVGKKAQGLYDVAQFGSDSGEMILQIGHRLSGLGFHATFYDAAVTQAKLARDDDPIACANDGCNGPIGAAMFVRLDAVGLTIVTAWILTA